MPGVGHPVRTDLVTHGHDLDLLTEVSPHPGAHLDDLLQSLAQYRRQADPGGAGMTITLVVDTLPLAITAMDAGVRADEVVASRSVSLDALLDVEPGSSIEFLAADGDALGDSAPILDRSAGAGAVAPDAVVTVTGLEEMIRANQAIGMLLGEGYTPEAARAELHRRGRQPKVTVPAA